MGHEAHFTWFQLVPVLRDYPNHVVATLLVVVILMVFTLLARISLAAAKQEEILVPASRLSFLGFFDIVAEGLFKLTESILGKDARKFLPITGTLFLFIFISNLLGLVPGFSPPTDNVNTTLACGLFVFIYYNYLGIREGGIHYLKHFLGPVWYMAWLLLPIELISHAVRPFTLALRLKGNMVGDHTVLATFTDLVPYGVPVAVYFLGLLVCFIQAFVFVMLSMVYISMAKESEHH
jgi:F-type H+-transporting ATPase subunit a